MEPWMMCRFNRLATSAAHALVVTRLGAVLLLALGATHVAAHEERHVHGTVRLDVAVEGGKLTIQLVAPLDSLLGFEHRPRTDAQRKAAAALLEQMKDVRVVARPDTNAQCSLAESRVASDALAPERPGSMAQDGEHADLDATYEFTCAQPHNLRKLDIALFDRFKRIRRVEARVAGAKVQSGRVLTPANTSLPLVR
jgi:hypothetical protein